MRDSIKYIINRWNSNNGDLPNSCKFVPFSGGFHITNDENPHANWEVEGSTNNKKNVRYKIYSVYYPEEILEQGIISLV